MKDTTSTVKLLSHGAFDYDNPADIMPIKLFATDEPSNEGLKVSSLRVVGFDQYLQKHVYGQGKMRIYINRNLNLSPGKLAAQAVHAALQAMGVHHGLPVVVLQASPSKIQEMRTHIYDAGHTEVEPNTLTTGTEWPLDSNER